MARRIPITLACGDYDRTQALRTGEIQPEGVDLTYVTLPPEEVFFRSLRYQEFDAAELSLSSYVLSLTGGGHYVAIPVFPSRSFRHNGVYVNSRSGFTEPADLAGRLVGIPEYQMSAAVWIRGTFADRHGLPVAAPRYRTGGLHEPGRVEKLLLPDTLEVEVQPIPADATLCQLLMDGELDAIYSARMPLPFAAGASEITRLFADPRTVEERYFRETGIFPIMHVIALRRDVYERNRWLPRSLYKAFEQARRQSLAGIGETNALRFSAPWLYQDIERTAAVMGRDYWPYGVPQNQVTLTTLLRYMHEQGLSDRRYEPIELFAPETIDAFRV